MRVAGGKNASIIKKTRIQTLILSGGKITSLKSTEEKRKSDWIARGHVGDTHSLQGVARKENSPGRGGCGHEKERPSLVRFTGGGKKEKESASRGSLEKGKKHALQWGKRGDHHPAREPA